MNDLMNEEGIILFIAVVNILLIQFEHKSTMSQTIQQHAEYFGYLTKEHIPQATQMCARAFIQMNAVWKSFGLTLPMVQDLMREKIIAALEAEELLKEKLNHQKINFIYSKGGKIVAILLNYDLQYFFDLPPHQEKLEQFNRLEAIGRELQAKIQTKKYENLPCIYSIFAAVQTSSVKQGVSLTFWIKIVENLHSRGFRYCLARYSSEASLNLIMKLGAKPLCSQYYQSQNTKHMLTMAQLDFIDTFNNFLPQIKKKSQERRAKI